MKAVITGGEGFLAQHVRSELLNTGWEVFSPGRAELDVGCARSVNAYFSRIDTLDLLVNNAGQFIDIPLYSMTESDFTQVLDACLKGAFLCSQAAVKIMCRQKAGHIIHIGSYSALIGPAGQANYAAAKAGLLSLSQSIAKEYGQQNIRSNCVLPGLLASRMTKALFENEKWREESLSRHVLGRFSCAQDAAHFIHFLHSMPHVSGQVFQLDSRISAWD